MVTLKSSYYKTKRVTMIIIARACSIYKEKKESTVANSLHHSNKGTLQNGER